MAVALVSIASIKGTLTVARDGGDAVFPVSEGTAHDVANGTGLGQANAAYVDDFSIAASGTLDIDLSGTLVDPNKETIVFTAVKEILVVADAANVNNVIVGGAAATQFVGPFGGVTHTIAVKPGGRFNVSEGYSAAGWAVAAGSTDLLRLTNSGGTTAVTGTIVIVGEA